MKLDLAVIGQGAVTPAGIGIDALLHGKPVQTEIAPLGQPDKTWPVLRVNPKDPAFSRWQREPRLRRASPIAFFLVEAAEQALTGVSAEDRKETGLIVAFSAGCLVYSRRFFEGIIKQGQRSASPALFPETVFNSPVSHVATVLGLNGAAYALVGDESAWVGALQTASVWLQMERVKQVVVLGVEEFDPLVLDAYRSVRWLRRQNSAHGFLTSEGAAGVLVRRGESGRPRIISTRDGFIYRTQSQAAAAAEKLLDQIDPKLPLYPTAKNNWLGPVEEKATQDRCLLSTKDQPYLGEAFTASAAWNTLRALRRLSPETPQVLLPIWGLNHQLAFLQLGNGNS
jgi:Beta-ketoacyl synthase, N-terminal domain